MSIETRSQDLADLLVTRNFEPEYFQQGRSVPTAHDADMFSFDYVAASGRNYGTVVIMFQEDETFLLLASDNMARGMEEADADGWFAFMNQLKRWAVSPGTGFKNFSIENIARLRHHQAGMAAIREGLFEGYYGTRQVSYVGEATQARLMIRHSRPLGEGDARHRQIDSLFVETADGERYRLPFRHLAGGRAMLEHVRSGGRPWDVRGAHIVEMVSELAVLSRFRRASAGRVLEGTSQQVAESADHYYKSIKEHVRRLGTSRGYAEYFESWLPDTIGSHEELVENIREMFVQHTLDPRIEAALPVLARIQQQGNVMKEIAVFEAWVDRVTEGTWALPETPEQKNQLSQLLGQPLIVGTDAADATEQLYDLVGDDHLFDLLSELADRDPGANAWDDSAVMDRMWQLADNSPELADALTQVATDTPTQPNSDKPGVTNTRREVNLKKTPDAAPDWTALGEALSVADKISIFEAYYGKGTILESNDNSVEYFHGLGRFSVDPVKNKKYIVTPLMLIQNRVLPLNSQLLKLTFVDKSGDQLVFARADGSTMKFPESHQGQQGLVHTFVFNKMSSYNDFRSELALKFDLSLPNVNVKQHTSQPVVAEGSELPPNVVEMIKKIAQSSATPEHKKAAIDALVEKYSKHGVAEGRLPQLPTRGADYSGYDTEHLKAMLKPGIMHRNELKFKTLIRRELKKREAQAQQGVAEGSLNEGQYEMMMRNGQVKKFIAKDDADAKRIAAGHGAKSVIKLRGGVPAGKVSEQGVAEGSNDYFKRRKDEEDRIAGTKPPAKRIPRQTDYEKKRKQQGVAEGADVNLQIKRIKDRILQLKDWNTAGTHDKKIKELQARLKELQSQKQGVAEGRVKQLQMDLTDLTDAEFQQKYHMTKDQARKNANLTENAHDSAVASAITQRIMLQRVDLLSTYGPELVGQAIDQVADSVGSVDEIGSSDVSAWVRYVEQLLLNMNNSSVLDESQADQELTRLRELIGR